ncbi:hypothetical protein BSR19_04525 [Streptococcus salivarius]|uniref:Uncharacterized protein n=1 Tax=Streptococcus salivarius TaxID=1304 RepID=A0A2S5FM93_STRSL|nr:hypothetical protein A6J79_07160 [Streptococcus equinus]PPA33600.1 hypothetical protein CGZ74_04320 [Streptococcus salivarius]PZD56717.1 hypothetical protein CKU37_03550 [Streptococcus salivarius]QGU80436.1 hypothetical protein BSR19_04525 [Streptococcus salivarius]
MFRNSTITDLFLFVFTEHIVYYPLQNIDINILFYFVQKITTNDHIPCLFSIILILYNWRYI